MKLYSSLLKHIHSLHSQFHANFIIILSLARKKKPQEEYTWLKQYKNFRIAVLTVKVEIWETPKMIF